MQTVLADSSFWIALRNERDVEHLRAKALVRKVLGERNRLLVTPLIFAEVHATFSRSKILRNSVIKDFWHNPTVIMETLTPQDYREALDLLELYRDKDFPFCDATSFVVMERLSIKRALSFDRHFQQYGGFEVLE